MDDLISRQAVLNLIEQSCCDLEYACDNVALRKEVEALPSAQSEVRPIDYQDCSNAMLKMWMDNVVTDGEYNRIMDKLNAHWGKKNG